MIEECNFKSKIRHPEAAGCNLTPNDIICPGEENCILYQIYKNDKWMTIAWKGGLGGTRKETKEIRKKYCQGRINVK